MNSRKCCVKDCKIRYSPKCGIHFFRFPLKDKNRLDKWIAAVKRPNWKPKYFSTICSLHFNQNDIMEGLGYERVILRPNAVPKYSSSSIVENKQNNAILELEEVCNAENNKSQNYSKTYISRKSTLHDHNYFNSTCERNSELVEKSSRLIQNLVVLRLNKKQIAVEVKPREYAIMPDTQSVTSNSTDTESEEETDEKTIQSGILKKLRCQNKALKRKLERRDKTIASMKKMVNELQQRKLTNNDPL